MARRAGEPLPRLGIPPTQHNLEQAAARSLAALAQQPAEQLEWLGARRAGEVWTVPVLDDSLSVQPGSGAVCTSAGRPTGPWWRILTLHYLTVSTRPADAAPAVTFADLPGGRIYAPVYRKRVIERLCRAAGRDEPTLRAAGQALAGRPTPDGDAGFDFQVYPRVRLRLVWYAGDEQLPASAVLLLPRNIESFFGLEDIVVLSERVVCRLSGGRF